MSAPSPLSSSDPAGTNPRLRSIDVVGDLHGHATKLRSLLNTLGYEQHSGTYVHPSRTAVFVGDLIDRGPQQVETVEIVRKMVDFGSAVVVLGNHELNALAYATLHRDLPGEYLRTRLGEKGARNHAQHAAFLEEVRDGSMMHRELLDWFMTLPLWLETDQFRVVHACWSQSAIDRLSPLVGPNNTLTVDLLHRASDPSSVEFQCVETLLKGPEIELPSGYAYLDKDNHPRHRARQAWWDPSADSYRTAALFPPGSLALDGSALPQLPDTPLGSYSSPYDGDVPVFVGHYWRVGRPSLLSVNVACVDYSAGKGGPLAAYRFNAGEVLDERNFVLQG